MTPFVPEAAMPPITPSQTIEIDLVMVMPPNPPLSRQLISPPAAVFEIAPANVLHGAVRLHGLTSSPTPETQVRVAWACAGAAVSASAANSESALMNQSAACRMSFIGGPPLLYGGRRHFHVHPPSDGRGPDRRPWRP